MKKNALLLQLGALCVALALLAAPATTRAQAPTESAPPKPAGIDELTQAELLKSYLQIRDQLHATQLAIANSRAETESTARAQATAIAEKLVAIKAAMETERQRQQVETLRANAERERQQMDAQRSNRTVLWVAVGFGAIGLLAMLFMPLIQLRTINRIAEVATQRSPAPAALMGSGETDTLPGHTVALSNQRLMSVIERMEKRIFELEHTTTHPLAAAVTIEAKTSNGSEAIAQAAPATNSATNSAADQAARISVLLDKGKFLLSTNKAKEAVAVYDEVLKINANHAEALVKKGAALEKLKQDDAAIRCYDRAIEVNQKMTIAYLSKAGVCNRLGRYDEAMECYEHALETEDEAKS
jgi:tetratricopeptide (TPR) repeat protein